MILAIGAYGQGLHVVEYDAAGRLTPVSTVPIADPSYAAFDADRGVLYSVVEQTDGRIAATRLGPDGTWSDPGEGASTKGAHPCHLAVHPSGSHLFVANYSSGSVAVFPLDAHGGITGSEPSQLIEHQGSGPVPDRQEGPHAHMVEVSPDGRFVLCADLGTDTVYVYAFDAAAGTLAPHDAVRFPDGSGPRHLAFHGSGRYAYVLNELSDTIAACSYDPAEGRLTPGTTIPVRTDDASPDIVNYPGAIRVSADDRFVYTSNRGDDAIAVFGVEDSGATLRPLDSVPCGGAWPRDIVLSPDGGLLFAANQLSDSVAVFQVDRASGSLTPVGEPYPVPTPSSVLPITPSRPRP